MTDQKELNSNELDQVVGGAGYTMSDCGLTVNADLCVGCGACEAECPMGAIHENGPFYEINSEECITCYTCMGACPVGAIEET